MQLCISGYSLSLTVLRRVSVAPPMWTFAENCMLQIASWVLGTYKFDVYKTSEDFYKWLTMRDLARQ